MFCAHRYAALPVSSEVLEGDTARFQAGIICPFGEQRMLILLGTRSSFDAAWPYLNRAAASTL